MAEAKVNKSWLNLCLSG